MTKYVIINSDDFGISEGVNRGILEAHNNGVLTSTCTMVNMPAAADGIQQAHAKAPDLGVGLHLTLSFGQPVSSPKHVPTLVDANGLFPQTYDQMMDRYPMFSEDDLEREVQAQFDRFVELADQLPTHIDSHHRAAYLHPASFEVMCRLCAEHELPMRRPTWIDHPAGFDNVSTNIDGTLVDQLRAIYEKYGSPHCTDNLGETFQWERGDRLPLFQSVLAGVTDGYTEVICHVGYADGLTESYTAPREDELAAVLHPALHKTIVSNAIELITFADLPTN